jgi:hypothetical protein
LALLPGWRTSKGARVEVALAIAIGMKVERLVEDEVCVGERRAASAGTHVS